MELEEMKSLWEKMSQNLKSQKLLTDKMIVQMIENRYENKFQNLILPETIASVICLATAIFIVSHFEKMDTWYLELSSVFAVTYLIILPIFSLQAIYRMKNINISKQNYKQTLIDYNQAKKQYQQVIKWGFFLNFFLMISVLLLTLRIFGKEDVIFSEMKMWLMLLPLGILFVIIVSKYAYRLSKSTMNNAEQVLKELDK